MQRAIGCAEYGDNQMSRMVVDLSGQAVILQESVEDEEDVLIGNTPIRIKKSEEKNETINPTRIRSRPCVQPSGVRRSKDIGTPTAD